MTDSNLRPISAACSLLLGAVQGKDEVDRDVKQREWIWEFFLKNNTNGRLLLELMNALPFPNANLYLKRLLLLRSLSLQLSSGLFDELTLDILMALEEIGGEIEGLRARVDGSEAPRPPAKKRRVSEENNVDTQIPNPEAVKAAVKRGLPESLIGMKSFRSRKGGKGEQEKPNKTRNVKTLSGRVPTDEDGGSREEFSYLQCRGPHWELKLAVIVELTVKHLRGVSVSRRAFEGALSRYWGDFIKDTEEPVAEWLDFHTAREEIKNELWKVHGNLDFLDEVTCKYNEGRVREMLASFLEKAWAETPETFLEKVSSDVVIGIYEPLNPDVKRKSVGGVVGEDGPPVKRRELSSEKPFVRSSRGKFSRSREKLQKTFGVLAINARRELENEQRIAPECLIDSGENGRSTEVVKTSKHTDGLVPPQAGTAEESLRTKSTSHGFGKKDSVIPGSENVDIATTEANESNHEALGRSQPDDEVFFSHMAYAVQVEECGVSDKGTTCDRLAEDQRKGNTSPASLETRGKMDCSVGGLRKGKRLCHRDQESSEDAGDRTPKNDRAAVNRVDISSPSPQPLAQIQGCLSPPPWVASALKSKELASEFTGSRTDGLVEVEAGNIVAEVSSAGNLWENSGIDPAERLRKEGNPQTEPDVVVQVSSPKVQEKSQGEHRFMQRNATARTFEWDDEDDISESPPSPIGSKRVTRGRTSPLNINCSTSSSLQRRKPRKWSPEETELLKNEVFKYGKGRWKLILANNHSIFHGRTQVIVEVIGDALTIALFRVHPKDSSLVFGPLQTSSARSDTYRNLLALWEVDLKDKWRNLERFEGLSVRDE